MEYEFLTEVAPRTELEDGKSTTPVYRSNAIEGKFQMDHEGCRTVFELFKHSCEKYSTRPMLGRREKLPGGAVGDFQWQTYREVEDTVIAVSKGLQLLGCQKGAKIAIFGANAPEWTQTMLACYYFSAVCVPMYDTLGLDVLEYVMGQAEIEAIFVAEKNCKTLGKLIQSMQSRAEQIREICIWSDYSNTGQTDILTAKQIFEAAGINVETWADLIHRGESSHAASIDALFPPEDPENTAVLLYTSGTTGIPKGVVMSHRAIVATVAAGFVLGKETDLIPENGVHLSWLTMAHVYGMVMEILSFVGGGKIGYWQGKVDRLGDDIATLKPTQLLGVPRIWNTIVDRALDRIDALGWFIKLMFDFAFSYKKAVLEQTSGLGNFMLWLLDYTFFERVRQTLGGRIQYVASGAAPLPRHVEEFLRVALTAPLIQGYGLSETGGMTFATFPHRFDLFGTVGSPLTAVEFRLESVPEMNYNAQGNPPAGEICLRGPCLFSEYYKNQEEYRKAVDREGFFHTGDIAELHPTGALKIVDRKKNIFKLAQGEYVAVEKIESILAQASSVKQIWVYGDSYQRFLVAIVHPNCHRLNALLGEEDLSLEVLCTSDNARKHVLKELTAVGRGAGLKGFECVREVALTTEEFTIDNGMLTPAHKLKRHDLLKKYKDAIDTLYAESA